MDRSFLKVRVTPRSSRDRIIGWRDGVLSVKLTAPPVKGAANKACIAFLADLLGISRSQVALGAGATRRDKTFEIAGLSREEIERRILDAVHR